MTMLGGVDPGKLAKLQEVTKRIKATVTANYSEGLLEAQFSTGDPEAASAIPGLVEQLAAGLIAQLSAYFAMEGELVETGRPR